MRRTDPFRALTAALVLVASSSLAAPAEPEVDHGAQPAASAGPVIGFDAAVARALARNPTARVAADEIRRAEAAMVATRSDSLPTLTGNLAYLRLDHDRVLNGSVIAAANQFSGSVSLVVPLVAAGHWVEWSHAKEGIDVARASTSDVRRQLAVSVARTYLALVAQHRVIDALERSRDTARAHLDFAHRRYAGGYGTRVDEVRAAEELRTVEAQVEGAQAQLTRLREALGVLLATDGAVDVDTDVELPSLPPEDEALRDAARERTDVLLLRRQLHLAERTSRDTWTTYLPSLVGVFQPFFQDPPTLTLPRLGWQAQVALSLPLFDGGLRYGQARERKIDMSQTQARLEGTLRQASSEVRAAVADVERSQAALGRAREAAEFAAEALRLTTLAYEHGASTNIEVIDAERHSRDAETAVAVAEDALRQAQLGLLVASGRFPKSG